LKKGQYGAEEYFKNSLDKILWVNYYSLVRGNITFIENLQETINYGNLLARRAEYHGLVRG